MRRTVQLHSKAGASMAMALDWDRGSRLTEFHEWLRTSTGITPKQRAHGQALMAAFMADRRQAAYPPLPSAITINGHTYLPAEEDADDSGTVHVYSEGTECPKCLAMVPELVDVTAMTTLWDDGVCTGCAYDMENNPY